MLIYKCLEGLTAIQKENLYKLACHLAELKNPQSFDMGLFSDNGDNKWRSAILDGVTELYCGSCGCAIGHGPEAGIKKLYNETWIAYACRVFGVSDATDPIYEWCFDSTWSSYDNTPSGAAKRILFMLCNDGIPAKYNVWEPIGSKNYLNVIAPNAADYITLYNTANKTE